MSASPVARQATQCQIIPSKRVLINDPNQLPADYSSTPGGTLYSTTPGVPVTGRLRLEAGQVDLPGTRTLLTNHVREKRPGTRTNSATGSCPGTRIVYERAFLMNLRNSPISRTPPRNIPAIPADLLKGTASAISITPSPTSKDIPVIEETPAEQFEMDM